MKAISAFILLFFSVAVVTSAAAEERPGTVCESIDHLLERGAAFGMAPHERIDEVAAIERARDVFDAMPPKMARPRGQWLLLADLRSGSMIFGFVTGAQICDIAFVPASMAAAVRRFIAGLRA